MGSIECDRIDCDEIMCEFMHAGKYICSGCLYEFKQNAGCVNLDVDEWNLRLSTFMKTVKNTMYPVNDRNTITVDQFVDSYVGRR